MRGSVRPRGNQEREIIRTQEPAPPPTVLPCALHQNLSCSSYSAFGPAQSQARWSFDPSPPHPMKGVVCRGAERNSFTFSIVSPWQSSPSVSSVSNMVLSIFFHIRRYVSEFLKHVIMLAFIVMYTQISGLLRKNSIDYRQRHHR